MRPVVIPLVARLLPHVRRIVAPDYPGHGFSAEPTVAVTPEALFDSMTTAHAGAARVGSIRAPLARVALRLLPRGLACARGVPAADFADFHLPSVTPDGGPVDVIVDDIPPVLGDGGNSFIPQYFETTMGGGTLVFHQCQYDAYSGTVKVSQGGTCN